MLTSSTKGEVRYFHVVVVQWRQRSTQKSVMHVQSCCFANLRACLHGLGDPGLVGWFPLFSRTGGHKTKETYPTRPGFSTPCKQGLNLMLFCRSLRRRRCYLSSLILHQENALQLFLSVVTLWLIGYKTVLHTMHKTNKSAFWQATMFVNYLSKNWRRGSYWVFLLLHHAVTGTSQKLKPEPSAGKGPFCYQATISWFVPIHPIHLNKGNSQFGYCWETAIEYPHIRHYCLWRGIEQLFISTANGID